MTVTRRNATAESVRKAAAAAFEALPALLLAAALLMPAVAAVATRAADADTPPQAAPAQDVGREIAEQGNRALVEIREEAREALRQNVALPKLS
jgi:hypothetical protein